MNFINQIDSKMQFFREFININPFPARKQIFSEYKLPDDPIKVEERIQISKDKRNSNEILLRQLGMFKFNLSSVLSQKNYILERFLRFQEGIARVYRFVAEYNEGEIDHNQEIERKFRSIQNLQNESEAIQNIRSSMIKSDKRVDLSVRPQYLMDSLIIYKELLSLGQSLKYEASTFRLGTVSNFNPLHTQAKFSKTPTGSEQAVLNYIQKMIVQSSKAMESKVRFQSNYEKDRFLLQEDKYVNSWKSLEEMYNPKQVEFINFEMLNVLNAFDLEFERFDRILETYKANYRKYQGVADSMNLMQKQIQQMTHIIKTRDEIIQSLSARQFRQSGQIEGTIQKCDQEQQLIQKNIKIYHINQKLLAFYNTETNLKSYSQQRNNYIQKLSELSTRMDKWKIEHVHIKEIAHCYRQIDDIINRKSVSHANSQYLKNVQSTPELEKIIVRIEEVNVKKNSKIITFKNSVLQEIRLRLKNLDSNNTTGVRNSIPILTSSNLDSTESEILQKQKSLLLNLSRTPYNEKKIFMIKNGERIKEYVQYNKKKREDLKLSQQLKNQMRRFQWQFSILEEIVNVSTQLRNSIMPEQMREQFSEYSFDQVVKKHLKTMQDQIKLKSQFQDTISDDLIYKHVYDYSLFDVLFQSDHWYEFCTNIQKLQTSFISRPVSFTSSTNVLALKQLISFTKTFVKQKYSPLTLNMLEIFSSTLFRLKDGLSSELYVFQSYFWEKMAACVTKFYQKNNYEFEQNLYKDKTIDKSSFFSLPYLIHLNRTSKTNKVLNLDESLTKIVKHTYDQFNNMREEEVFENAVCLTYLITYIRNVCSQEEFTSKFVIFSKLRRVLTSHLLKSQFTNVYESAQKGQTLSKSKLVTILLGLEGYITFQDQLFSETDRKSKFETQNEKYIKALQQQTKPLLITVSAAFLSIQTISTISSLWEFESWISETYSILSRSESLKPAFTVSYLFTLRQQFYSLLRLVESPQCNKLKQSDGFLIRTINKENFYLKKQVKQFKLLKKESIWERFDQILNDSISKLETQNLNLNKIEKSQLITSLKEIDAKVKKILINEGKNILQ